MFKAANELKKTNNWSDNKGRNLKLLPKVSDKQVLLLPSGTNNIDWKTKSLHFSKGHVAIMR
jgi:hypothetical protein